MKKQTHSPAGTRRKRGFTLIELLIVILLVAGLLAVIAGKVMTNKKRAEARLASTQLNSLAAQVDQYQADVGSYPDSLEQLVAAPGNVEGWLGPYAKKSDFQDPWHNAIQYKRPGDDDAPYTLLSLGADGKAGGEGVDKDVTAP
jgi:general secretion pathway protein G